MTRAIEELALRGVEAFLDRGITPEYLARKLKQELNYKEPKEFVVGEDVYSRRVETASAKRIQQQARMDAQKLLGMYPAERHEVEHGGSVTVEAVDFSDATPDDKS